MHSPVPGGTGEVFYRTILKVRRDVAIRNCEMIFGARALAAGHCERGGHQRDGFPAFGAALKSAALIFLTDPADSRTHPPSVGTFFS